MDAPSAKLKQTVLQVLQDYVAFLGSDSETQLQLIVDEKNDHYLLTEIGWQGQRRIYGTLIHCDIVDGKIWIQQDGTEDGIAPELMALGVDQQQIVLGFKSMERRQITDFAVA
jgi:hypothetical protein